MFQAELPDPKLKRLLFIIPFIWAVLALLSPWLPLTPNQIHLAAILQPPGELFLLGADELGRPILDRLLAGAQVSLLVAVVVVSISMLIGVAIGTTAAYLGGAVDRVLSRLIDIFLAFPGILLAIALAAILGPGIDNVIIALTAMGWVGFARLSRVQAMSAMHTDYVNAARAFGSKHWFIVSRHLLPQMVAPVMIEISYGIAGTIVAEAGLSFLGLGVQAPDASWGNMLQSGVRYMLVAPHLVLAPGIALSLVVLSVNLLGDRLTQELSQSSY